MRYLPNGKIVCTGARYHDSGCKPLPSTFDTEFINHVNHGLFDDCIEPTEWFSDLHNQFDGKMGRNEVERHITHAIKGTEFDPIYAAFLVN